MLSGTDAMRYGAVVAGALLLLGLLAAVARSRRSRGIELKLDRTW
jgi:MYXO-CTERM domain-containing protein